MGGIYFFIVYIIGSELLYFSDKSCCMWHIIHLQQEMLSLEFVYSLQEICLLWGL
jgi:hypothetical protein